jgi:sugar lactone lactonase YvrE
VTLFAGQLGGWGGRDAIGTAARFATPMDVVSDGNGTLYVADASNHAVRKIVVATGAVTTLAGSFTAAGSVDAIGPAAQLWNPWGLAYDAGRNALYVADATDQTIRRIALADGAVTTLAGKSLTWGKLDASGKSARFHYPKGLAFDGASTLYVADTGNSIVRAIDLSTLAVTTLAGKGVPSYSDGTGTSAGFADPVSIAYDAGNLYVADSTACSIRKIVVASAEVTTFVGLSGWTGNTDGTGTAARFREPNGISADHAGHLYVSDAGLRRVRQVDIGPLEGTVGPLAGGGAVLWADGVASAAGFRRPAGSCVVGGTLYVADSSNSDLRAIDLSTAAVTSPYGLPAHIGADDGPAANATFYQPSGLAVDENDRVYVSESQNAIVRSIDSGMVSVLSGQVQAPGHKDGLGTMAKLFTPRALAYDGAGKLYLPESLGKMRRIATADGDTTSPFPGVTGGAGVAVLGGYVYYTTGVTNQVRRVEIATGDVSLFAGDPATNQGTLDAAGTAARFSIPMAMTTDGIDRLFVADYNGETLRQIDVSTTEVTTIAGAPGLHDYHDDVGTAAHLVFVQSLAWRAGAVYLAETSMHTVRKLELSTGQVSTYAGIPGVQVVAPGSFAQATLNSPGAIAFLSDGTLLVASLNEHSIVAVAAH